ncbi:hypothetical protein SAMN05443574_14110 [Haloarcula vallismortis]|uniref:Uncharacterized protein n=1 Tax=Haloarcula vallismortis TaxID=28442 RepID=A0A1H3B9U0_HALVA|nr:hypothetical protein SAMN05443574_14110 [Haloarcula vallismortis]
MHNRAIFMVIVAGVLLLSGCNSPSEQASIMESEATDRALEAETEYVSARLQNASCLTYGETGEFTTSAEATVINRTQDGVVVNVQRPYSWEKDGTVADLVSNASYLVTENQTIRRSGTSIAPC